LRFGDSGKYLICLIRDNVRWQVRTWDFEKEMEMDEVVQMQKLVCSSWRVKKDLQVIQALTVNMDNSRLATVTIPHAGTWNGRVKLWNPVTAEVLWEQEHIFRNQDCVSPGFSPDGRFLACYDGKNGGLIFVVDAVAAKVIDRIPVASLDLVSLALDVNGCGLAIATTEIDILEPEDTASNPRFYLSRRVNSGCRPFDVITTWGTQNSMTVSYTADGTKLLLAARDRQDNLCITVWNTESSQIVSRVVHNQERYVWFKMFGGFRLLSEDRIIIHVDYISRDTVQRSSWRERMLVLTPDGKEVERFEAGSSRMTITENRVIFLDNEYWIISWDGHGSPKRHVKLPVDVGFAISGLSFSEGKLTLISRTEEITVVEVKSLK
jgi:hypothetical protein